MTARIYQPARTAMQSGLAMTRKWVLEFEPTAAPAIDPLTGWTSSADTRRQVRLLFDTRVEAVAYAERNGLAYAIEEPQERRTTAKSYSDNFRWNRAR